MTAPSMKTIFRHVLCVFAGDPQFKRSHRDVGGKWVYLRQMLASCAFNVLTGEHGMKPGTVNPDIISQYLPNATMKPHVLRAGVFL